MELAVLQGIQSIANPFLDYLFIGITVLGEQLVAVALLTVVYWLLDKETGEYMCFSLISSLCINGLIKNICRFPRPIGQEGVRSLRVETATGYSFPSGHTQTTATLYFSAAWRVHRTGVTVAAAVLTLVVAFSRLYLGVHWPKDVLVAMVLGIGISFAVYLFFSSVDERGREISYAVAAVVFAPLVYLWHDPDFVKTYGLLLGFSIAMPLEHRFVRFTIRRVRTTKAKLLREFTGLAVLAIVKMLLSLVLPDTLPFLLTEYALVALTAFLLCPILFVKLHI